MVSWSPSCKDFRKTLNDLGRITMKTVRNSGSVSSGSDAEQRASQLSLNRAGSEPRERCVIGFRPMPETCGARWRGGRGTGGQQCIWTCLCRSGLASGCRSWARACSRCPRERRCLRGSGGRFPRMPRPAECARSEPCRERPTRDRARWRVVPLEIAVECSALGRADRQSPGRDRRSKRRVWIAPVSRSASVPDASAHRTKGLVHILRPTAAKSMAHATQAASRTRGSWRRVREPRNSPTLYRGAAQAKTDARGRSVRRRAVSSEGTGGTELPLGHGADPSAANLAETAPSHLAATRTGSHLSVETVVRTSADCAVHDALGRTPSEVASDVPISSAQTDSETTGALPVRLGFSGDRAEWMLCFELLKFLTRPFWRNQIPSVSKLLVQSLPRVIARKTAGSTAFLLVPPWSLLQRLSEKLCSERRAAGLRWKPATTWPAWNRSQLRFRRGSALRPRVPWSDTDGAVQAAWQAAAN